MATQTDNYKLTKPAGSDKYNVAVFNANADILDAQIKSNANEIAKKQKTITGAVSTGVENNFTPNRVTMTNASGKLAVSDIEVEKLGYIAKVTSDIQGQLDGKLPIDGTAVKATGDADGKPITTTYAKKADVDASIKALEEQISSAGVDITGAASTVVSANLTADRVTISNASGKIAVSDITPTELEYLDGVTSNIQTQLNSKVVNTRKVNGKALDNDIALTYTDVGALSSDGKAVSAGNADSATKAIQDGDGNNIVGTYATKTALAQGLAGKQSVITVSTSEPTVDDLAEGEFWAVVE